MPAVDVFAGAIHFLKEHLMNSVNSRNPSNRVEVRSVRWVLTVPAIWSDAATQFMRYSAEKVIPFSKLLNF